MKARFLTPVEDILITPFPGSPREWVVRTDIYYWSEVAKRTIHVPKNFITDLGSIPRSLWWLYPPYGKYTLAVILHDIGYWLQFCPREIVDAVLREAIVVCKDTQFTANVFYSAVRIGGWKAWANNSKQDKATGFVREAPGAIIVPRISRDFCPGNLKEISQGRGLRYER